MLRSSFMVSAAKKFFMAKERQFNARGNKARRSKDSILADTQNLLLIYQGIYNTFPKIDRIDGAAAEFKRAAWDIVRNFKMAKECPEVKEGCIRQIFGCYGIMDVALRTMDELHLLTDKQFFAIAEKMEKIEEGVRKWKRSLPASGAEECRQNCGSRVLYPPSLQEASDSTEG